MLLIKGDSLLLTLVILPPSALSKLTRLEIVYPMLFELTHGKNTTHAGVLEL